MTINTVARHCDVPDFIIRHANEKIGRLTRFEPRLTSAEVVFEVERHLHRVEAVLSLHGAQPVVARAEGADFRVALDRVTDRLGKILRRRRAHLVARRVGR